MTSITSTCSAALALTTIVICGAASADPEVANQDEVVLTAKSLDAASIALRDFKTKRSSWRCFDVVVSKDGDDWLVEFSPSDNVIVSESETIVGTSKCGSGISYRLDDSGKIVNTYLSR